MTGHWTARSKSRAFFAILFACLATVIFSFEFAEAAPESVVARHQADIEKILSAKSDYERDRILKDAMAYLATKESRIGTWLRPDESLPQRYGDLLNAYAYSEFSNTAASIRGGAELTMKKAERRLRETVEHVFREHGSRLLPTWEHGEVTQTRVSDDDIYRLMVDRLANEDKKFPRMRILEERKATIAGIHILQMHETTSVTSTEILMKIKTSPAFDAATRAQADSVLQTTRSALSRGIGKCQMGFRFFGGG